MYKLILVCIVFFNCNPVNLQVVVRCPSTLNKPAVLHHLIKVHGMKKALVFTKSSENAHTLTVLLKQYGHSSKELYSKVAGKRAQILNQVG